MSMAFLPPVTLSRNGRPALANGRNVGVCNPASKSYSWLIPTKTATPTPGAGRTTMVQSEVKSEKSEKSDSTTGAGSDTDSGVVDWANLGFQYLKTSGYVQCVYKGGSWGEIKIVSDKETIDIHIGATALHYGQSCFEGLKAFRRKDNSLGIFRGRDNARRLRDSAERVMMPALPEEKFMECIREAIRLNAAYVPPYGTRGALYIRPLLFGSGARVGLQPADEYTFVVFVVPVGDYYKGGLAPVTARLMDAYDRAAPNGIGHVKVAGNYAADLLPARVSKEQGYAINLYLDAKNRRTIEEFSTSNFFALKDGTYVTPKSPSILPSITNRTLMQLARDMGMTVEQRPVDIDELAEFDEVGACGTAVIITAVSRIVIDEQTTVVIGKEPDKVGDTLLKLYEKVRAIQYGEAEDMHGWCDIVRLE